MKTLLTALLIVGGLSLQAQTQPKADSVYLSGTIQHAAKYLDSVDAVEVMVNGPVSYQLVTYRAKIQPNGNYRVAFVKTGPLDVHLAYSHNLTNVLVQPGNHLQVNFDADNLDAPTFEGDNAPLNRELAAYRALQNQQNQSIYGTEKYAYYTTVSQKGRSEEPEAYRNFLRDRYQQDINLLNHYIKEQHPGTEFAQWAWGNLQCEYYNNVMRYAWLHPRANQIKEEDFKLPAGYFNFLLAKNFHDDRLALSSTYPALMHEYSIHLSRQTWNRPNALANEIDAFLALNNGWMKDVLLCDMLHGKASTKQVAQLDPYKKRIERNMTDSSLKALFNAEYQAALQQQAAYVTPAGNALQAAAQTTADRVLANLTSKYRGKVVYLDFWATWCSPCLAEMPHSKKLNTQLANNDVVFLYLASQCKDKDWKAMVADLKLPGEHVLLNNDDFNALSLKFQINGIPRYMLIDKTGRVIDDNARRPSDSQLTGDINKLLALN
jgi:thiol-disulfide isomerase/thioredoxin